MARASASDRGPDPEDPVTSGPATLDVLRAGAGSDIVLLHSLLSDRTAFDLSAGLVKLPHCGHSPNIQDPKAFWQAIRGFLRLAG